MKYLCEKLKEKILDVVLGELISYVAAWGWNQAGVQEMRRKFEGLLCRAESVPTVQQSNTANLRVRRLLRQLEDEARQGVVLLDGEPTPLDLSNAKERFDRILVVTLELNVALHMNGRRSSTLLAGVHLEVNGPPFKPRYLRRRSRLQVIFSCKYS